MRAGHLLLVLLLTTNADAAVSRSSQASRSSNESSSKTYFLGAGLVSEDMGLYSTSASSASTSLWATLYFDLTLAARYRLGSASAWLLSPSVGYTPLGVKSPDSKETSRLLTTGVRLIREIGPFDLALGPGLLHKSISASGGTVTLSNGHSTSDFGIPPAGSSMNLFYWDAGAGFSHWGFRLDLELLVTDLMSARRACDGILTVSYGLL